MFIWEELICCRSIIFPPKPCAARCLDHFSLSTSFRGICLINGEHQYAGFGCSTHTWTEGGEGLSTPIPQPGFRQPNSPAPRRKGNDGGHPLLAQVFPHRGWPLSPSVTREAPIFPGKRALPPAAASSGKVCKCLQPGGGNGARREGNKPPERRKTAAGSRQELRRRSSFLRGEKLSIVQREKNHRGRGCGSWGGVGGGGRWNIGQRVPFALRVRRMEDPRGSPPRPPQHPSQPGGAVPGSPRLSPAARGGSLPAGPEPLPTALWVGRGSGVSPRAPPSAVPGA